MLYLKRCSVVPYEGEEGFIFISYSHRDGERVYPIIEHLKAKGYRVWYDEGIDPGSEWPETIAEHLGASAICMGFISKNYLDSDNCKRELNFALRKHIPFLSIMLEPTEMSAGVEMQLSTNQAIFLYSLQSEDEFYYKLEATKLLRSSHEGYDASAESAASPARSRSAGSVSSAPKPQYEAAAATRQSPPVSFGTEYRTSYTGNDRARLFLAQHQDAFDAAHIPEITRQLDTMDDLSFSAVNAANYRSPQTVMIISVLVGALGIDRFFIGDIMMGVIKLVTFGGFGILTVIDWFLIMKKTRDINYSTFLKAAGVTAPTSYGGQQDPYGARSFGQQNQQQNYRQQNYRQQNYRQQNGQQGRNY